MVILGLIALMAWFVVQIIQRVQDEVVTRGFATDNDLLQSSAYQALEVTLAVLAEINELDGGLYSPAQGWGAPLDFARGVMATGVASDQLNADFPNLAVFEERPRFAFIDETGEASGIEPGDSAAPRLGTEVEPVRFATGLAVKIEVIDEGGKLPIATTNEARWNLFFQEMGFDEPDAKRLTDCLLDWMDADNNPRPSGAESEVYRQKQPPYNTPNRPVRHFDELRWIEGFRQLLFTEEGLPNDYYSVFVDNVSLHAPPALNYNTLSPLLLSVVAEERGFILDDLIRLREGEPDAGLEVTRPVLRPGMEADQLPRDANGTTPDFSAQAQLLTIRINVTRGAARYQLNALINTAPAAGTATGAYPFSILALTENRSLL